MDQFQWVISFMNFRNKINKCQCDTSYENCVLVTLLTLGNSTSNVTVDCAGDNGGCEQVCLSGKGTTIGHCACYSGYKLASYGLLCEGIVLYNRTPNLYE